MPTLEKMAKALRAVGALALAASIALMPLASVTPVERHEVQAPEVQKDVDAPTGEPYRRLDVSDYEEHLMARAVYSEARGEDYEGQVAVAAVIINRVQDRRWPGDVKGVVFEPWAFTAVHDGQFWLDPDQTAYMAVSDALSGWDPSSGATFYYNPVTATSSWVFTRSTITQIGKHVFAY